MKPTVVTQGEESYSFRDVEVEINGLTTASVCGEIHYELKRYSDKLPISIMPDVEITKVTMVTVEQYSVFTRVKGEHLYVGSSNHKDADWKDRSFIDWFEKEIAGKEERKTRASFGGRVNAEYEVNIDSYLTEFEADTLSHWADSKFISTKHIISECESRYIDKYTTAYNSEIMRAIMSHE